MQGGRRKAREILFRALFESEISQEDLLETLEYSLSRYRLTEDGRDYAIRLTAVLAERLDEIDQRIRARMERWSFERLSVAVRATLRRATAELLEAPEVHHAVVIDEAVETAKRYGEDGAGKFVNGVLDRLAEEIRGAAYRQDSGSSDGTDAGSSAGSDAGTDAGSDPETDPKKETD